MKFRTGLVIGAIAGYAIASRRAHRSDEDDGRGSILAAMSRHPSAQRLSDRGRRVIDLAGGRGTEAIRRARASLQRRLEASSDDLSMN
jgi:hypothetical protein